jgi:hypothetical protein
MSMTHLVLIESSTVDSPSVVNARSNGSQMPGLRWGRTHATMA